jgi:hypothetical protein
VKRSFLIESYLQKPIKILPSVLNNPQVSNQYWRNDEDSEKPVDEEIFHKGFKVFGLVCECVLFFHDECLVSRKRYVKRLPNKAFNQYVTYGPLSFAFHINEWYDLVDVVPDEGPNIAHDTHTVYSGLDGEGQHFVGPG